MSGVGDGGADHSAPARALPPRTHAGNILSPRVSGFVGGPGGGGARATRERRPDRASRRERLVGVVSSRRRRDRGRRAEHHPGRTRHGRDLPMAHPDPRQRVSHLQALRQPRAPAAAPAVPSVSSRSSRGAPLGSSLALDDARVSISQPRFASPPVTVSDAMGCRRHPRHPRDRWHGALTTTRARPHLRLPRIPEKFLQRAARQHARREIQLFSSESIS